MKSGAYWPYMLVLLLAGGVVINVAMVFVATREPVETIDNYYDKAVRWDEIRAAQRQQSEIR